MDSPQTRSPLRAMEPRPMTGSPAPPARRPKQEYTPTRSAPTAALHVSSSPKSLPMRPVETQHPDSRYAERAAYQEPRFREPQYQESQYQESQYLEPRFQEPRFQEPRYQDPRYHEPRYQEPRYQEHQYADNHAPQHQGLGLAPPAVQMQTPLHPIAPALDIASVRSTCQQHLLKVLRLRQQRESGLTGSADLEWQVRSQTSALLTHLKLLQAEVRKTAKGAQNHRWRRWLIGGFIATFVPIIRRLFRRGTDAESELSSNNTEYAFRKSKSLISRIKQSVLRHGHWATMAFFVFSVLYVFSNEVVFRVSKTIYKRIRRLVAKLEYGDANVTDTDLKMLEGWRWRVMLW